MTMAEHIDGGTKAPRVMLRRGSKKALCRRPTQRNSMILLPIRAKHETLRRISLSAMS